MQKRILTTGLLGIALIASAMGQSWTAAYDSGLKAAKEGRWLDARKAFQQARSNRPDDVSGPTNLPGPVTDARKWRAGAPYSPNFLSAYASFKAGMLAKPDQSSDLLKTAATEFEGLLKKKQISSETLFYLGAIYSRANQTDKLSGLSSMTAKANWKVDTEVLAPEEIAAISSGAKSTGTSGGIVQTIDAGKVSGYTPIGTTSAGAVAYQPKKFALIIANGDNKLAGFQIGHAANDARLIRDSISTNAGYNPSNIEVVINGSADQIRKTASALASRMPAEGTLFVFFTGAAVNIEGRDWLAGVDTQIATDTSSMVAKSELYRAFSDKGINIFSFYQVPRTILGGRFFGSEEPKSGRVSQMQATVPGDPIFSLVRDGNNVGVFALAMSDVFSEIHSGAIPITEYGWQVFYKIRRGQYGTTGGSSRQTPTLPVLQFLASDARF